MHIVNYLDTMIIFCTIPCDQNTDERYITGCKFPAVHTLETCEMPHNSNTKALRPHWPNMTPPGSPVFPRLERFPGQ